jgi:hypothetical protein
VPGFPVANRREARKLGLLHGYAKVPKPNASECKPLERMSVFAGKSPTSMLILMEDVGLIHIDRYYSVIYNKQNLLTGEQ